RLLRVDELEANGVAITPFYASEDNLSIPGRFNGRAPFSRIIRTFVSPNRVQDGVFAIEVEVRADPGKIYRHPQKLLAHAFSGGGVVVGGSFSIGIADGLEGFALIDKLRGENGSITDLLTIQISLFVHYLDLIATTDIQGKLDVSR